LQDTGPAALLLTIKGVTGAVAAGKHQVVCNQKIGKRTNLLDRMIQPSGLQKCMHLFQRAAWLPVANQRQGVYRQGEITVTHSIMQQITWRTIFVMPSRQQLQVLPECR
jgi:hypothetical protein